MSAIVAIPPRNSAGRTPNFDADTAAADRWEPTLSAEEERELAARIRLGDQDARRRLILANLRLVAMLARRYRVRYLSTDDLVQEGTLGLMRASDDFDPGVHGCRFFTYAEIWIKAFMHRTVVANGSMIRIPLHVHRRLERARRGADLRAETGPVPPRDPECETMPEPVVEREAEGIPLAEVVDRMPPPDEAADGQEQRILLEAALRRLSPVEAWVLRERFGLERLATERWILIPRRKGQGKGQAADSSAEPGSTSMPAEARTGSRRSYFHRSYQDLERDCGLSRRRVRQVEAAALEKLRDVLSSQAGRFPS
ncbi:MAG: sigma-70 family RNA polymerase sigma factor [Isosphaeraceae bacterium]